MHNFQERMHLIYSSQGDIRLMLVNMYWWARSNKVRMIKKNLLNTFQNFANISFVLIIPHVPLHNFKSLQISGYETKEFTSRKMVFCDYKIVIPNIYNYKSNTCINAIPQNY